MWEEETYLCPLITFVIFFDVYAGVIFTISRSNRLSAMMDICLVPVSNMEKADAGYSELWRTWTAFGLPKNRFKTKNKTLVKRKTDSYLKSENLKTE